jgi:type I restriction enzyme R subunit
MAGYHQFHAVNVAVEETLRAAKVMRQSIRPPTSWASTKSGHQPGGEPGRSAGGRGVAYPRLGQEPDDGLLCGAGDPAPDDGEPHHRGADRSERPGRSAFRDVRALPRSASGRTRFRRPTGLTCVPSSAVASGGVVFTTIQKFFPEEKGDLPVPSGARQAGRHPVLSDRRNIVVIADEAHRSQYDFHRRVCPAHAGCVASTRHSSDSPGRPSNRPMPIHARSSGTTSVSTTSSGRSWIRRPCPSTTRAGWPSWN